MFSFILTSAPGMQLAEAQAGKGTMFASEGGFVGSLHTVNPSNGATVPVGPFAFPSISGMTMDHSTATMFASAGGGGVGGEIYTVNPNNGQLTSIGNSGFVAVQDLAASNGGILYGASTFSGPAAPTTIITINKANGLGTALPNPTGVDGIQAIAFAPDGTLYGATKTGAQAPQGDQLFTIDVNTGIATPVAPILDVTGVPHPGGVVGLQFGCDGTLYGSTGQGSQLGFTDLVTINPITGVFNIQGLMLFQGSSVSDLAFEDSCQVAGELIPIDSTALLLAGAQTSVAWLLPILISAVGIAIVIVRRN